MWKILLFASVLMLMAYTFDTRAQESADNYRIFDAQGNSSTLEAVLVAIGKADVVFLGEQHDDATAHLLQQRIFGQVVESYGGKRRVALSLEMFERDVQTVLDEYLEGLISETHFLAASRPWANYKTDYRPLLELARERKSSVIAANAPRRYVNMVSRLGKDSLNRLSPEARRWLAPLPYAEASPAYARKFNQLMGQIAGSAPEHSPLLSAQALWDATMAFSIAEFLRTNKDSLIVHVNGSFHSENRLGAVEQLEKFNPKARSLVVTMRPADDFTAFDKTRHESLGDFVILTAPVSARRE